MKHQSLARVVFSFLLCTAFFGILVQGRAIGVIVFGAFGATTLLMAFFAGLILVSSFGPASLTKRVGFWLGWIPLTVLVIIGNLDTGDWMTHLSSIPFLVSSIISVVIRVREKDGT